MQFIQTHNPHELIFILTFKMTQQSNITQLLSRLGEKKERERLKFSEKFVHIGGKYRYDDKGGNMDAENSL